MASLINKSEVRKFVLGKVQELRPAWGATRVSGEAIEKIEASLRAMIERMVVAHPSIGKTFKP